MSYRCPTLHKLPLQPSTNYHYRWDSPKGRITEYVKAFKVSGVTRILDSGKPVLEILRYVMAGRKATGVTVEVLGGVDQLAVVEVVQG